MGVEHFSVCFMRDVVCCKLGRMVMKVEKCCAGRNC